MFPTCIEILIQKNNETGRRSARVSSEHVSIIIINSERKSTYHERLITETVIAFLA
jgi:hypothetical protein